MKWLGKVIGGFLGYMMAGPLGLIIGVLIGHSIDQMSRGRSQLRYRWEQAKQTNISEAYFAALFTSMGSVAKADGYVSESEIHYAREIMATMGLNRAAVRKAIDYFEEGKNSNFKVGAVIAQLRNRVSPEDVLVQTLLETLLGMAYMEGHITPSQRAVLLQVSDGLGVFRPDFEQIERMVQIQHDFYRAYTGQYNQRQNASGENSSRHNEYSSTQRNSTVFSLEESYKILGITSAASDEEVKKTYRRLMSRHHPDKLIAKGLSEEAIKLATAKAQKIKAAYDAIKESRGFL